MQDCVRPFRALLQDLDSFGRRHYLELDFPAMSFAGHLFHHRQRSRSGADHKPSTPPWYVLLYRERCMPKPATEPFGRFFLALADAASVDHDVILISRSIKEPLVRRLHSAYDKVSSRSPLRRPVRRDSLASMNMNLNYGT